MQCYHWHLLCLPAFLLTHLTHLPAASPLARSLRLPRLTAHSVTAMLEAFVHDPLINWRLLNTTEAAVGPEGVVTVGVATTVVAARMSSTESALTSAQAGEAQGQCRPMCDGLPQSV